MDNYVCVAIETWKPSSSSGGDLPPSSLMNINIWNNCPVNKVNMRLQTRCSIEKGLKTTLNVLKYLLSEHFLRKSQA